MTVIRTVWCRGPFRYETSEGDWHFYRCKTCGNVTAAPFGSTFPDGHNRQVWDSSPENEPSRKADRV